MLRHEERQRADERHGREELIGHWHAANAQLAREVAPLYASWRSLERGRLAKLPMNRSAEHRSAWENSPSPAKPCSALQLGSWLRFASDFWRFSLPKKTCPRTIGDSVTLAGLLHSHHRFGSPSDLSSAEAKSGEVLAREERGKDMKADVSRDERETFTNNKPTTKEKGRV